MQDTICAQITGHDKAAVAIIRISGKETKKISQKILGFTPQARFAHFSKFKNSKNDIIDEGLAIFFSHENSFTGEDVLELQCHGGVAITSMMLDMCVDYGIRLAEAGEFSKRAFLNNKLDLLQAEAIADLIAAESTKQASAAIKSVMGYFSDIINSIVLKIIDIRTHIEANIDFSEEEDVELISSKLTTKKLIIVIDELNNLLKKAQQGRLLDNNINVVICGEPNAGKSTLLNTLVGEDAAIVTSIAGTTTDVIKEKIKLGDIIINISDTAGFRKTTNIIEKKGIFRANIAIDNADIILFLYDISQDFTKLSNIPKHKEIIFVANKIDKVKNLNKIKGHIYISATKKIALDTLEEAIIKKVNFVDNEDIIIARKRHVICLESACYNIAQALEHNNISHLELLAEDLRQTQNNLNSITGEFSTEDLLGEIFSNFCIGK